VLGATRTSRYPEAKTGEARVEGCILVTVVFVAGTIAEKSGDFPASLFVVDVRQKDQYVK